jgi:hypothetical protein
MARAAKPGDKGKDSKPATAPQGKTKAQEELDRFRARSAGAQAPGGAPASFAMAVPWMMPAAGQGGAPGWALPPSVMPYPTMPPMPGMQGIPGMQGVPPMPSGAGMSGVTDRMGSTLGLGFDVVNQLLAGSVRLLQGLAGAGYGYAAQGWGGHHGHDHGCGCGCGCGCDPCLSDCCGHDCCGHDCCDNSCCRPSVGNCC